MNGIGPQPMEHEFKTREEEMNFIKWIQGGAPTSKTITDRIKKDLKEYKKMKENSDMS